jgi:ribosomal protein S18 acetylase RimI-like enzyme
LDIKIVPLKFGECEKISIAFAEQGWNKPTKQYEEYLLEQKKEERVVLVAYIDSDFAGYVTIKWKSQYQPFFEKGIPEIMDLNVLIKHRSKGIATKLLDEAERIASFRVPTIGIGVGLMSDYGSAQSLYCQRGYIPDKRGISMHGKFLGYGDVVEMGDDVALYLTKEL